MLTRFLKIQLVIFSILTVAGLVGLSLIYLQLPTYLGVGMYRLYADLPNSAGLYKTANVTYRGTTVGKVLAVEPTVAGARVTMDINNDLKVPVDAEANVHSVSAVGEQFIDLVSPNQPNQYFAPGQTITKGSVPKEVGPALDAAENGLKALPKEKIGALLDYTSQAIGGLGPSLQHLVDGTQALAGDFKTNLGSVDDIVENSAPIIDSQVKSGDAIQRWSRNLNVLAGESAQQDAALRGAIQQAAPTADQLNAVFGQVRDALPQSLANVEIVLDMLKRYNKGLEQMLVVLPMAGPIVDSLTAVYTNELPIQLALGINQPPPCLTGFLPASKWRSPADTSTAPLESGLYCKIPKDAQNTVRGSRNLPCVDVPGKRAASPDECRDNKPYEPLGTNPWYGNPDQVLNCPAPAARCDQPVDPGRVIPAPSINNGMNPLPANMLPPPARASAPSSDPISAPGQGTVACSGQQPNPCIYTPAEGASATYNPESGQVVGPNGVKYSVSNSSNTGDDGWKEMLAPAS
ncbi:MAG: MlaD family protein [Mycobacterium sp.]|nr:MlaD family protein [Mycobacterium sp.]